MTDCGVIRSAGYNAVLRQCMHDHRPRDRSGWSGEQRGQVLLDPGDPAPVRLFRAGEIVEDRDCRHRVVRRIDHIIGHEPFDIADDRDRPFLDPACHLFGHAGLCLALTNGGVHGKSSFTDGSRTPALNLTPSPATTPSSAARTLREAYRWMETPPPRLDPSGDVGSSGWDWQHWQIASA